MTAAEISRSFLLINELPVYILVLFLGFHCISRRTFGKAMFILLFGLVYNSFLKSIFQDPLPEGMAGFAFPSGHMHSATIMWFTIIWDYRHKRILSGLIIVLVLMLAKAAVLAGYHYDVDVLAGIGFGIVTVSVFNTTINRVRYLNENIEKLGLILLPIVMGLFIITNPKPPACDHIWLAFGGLGGFSLGWIMLKKYVPMDLEKRLLVIIGISGIGILFSLYRIFGTESPTLSIIMFFALGYWVSGGVALVTSRLKPGTKRLA